MKPPALKIGDTIGIFSPSYPGSSISPEASELAIKFLEGKGYNVLRGSLTGKLDYYRSGSIKERADELNKLIENPEVKCIMAVTGGYVSNSILPYINYKSLLSSPKIIVGFSDITSILLGIYAKTGLITFYGPNLLTTFGQIPPFSEMSYKYFDNIVSSKVSFPYILPTPEIWTDDYVGLDEKDVYCTTHNNRLITLNNGKAIGRLIGGNLNTLQGIFGSPYMPQIEEGDILFLEDKNLDAETIERSFSMLKISGVFDKIGGLIIGKHIDFKDRGTGLKHYDILLEVIGTPKIPILSEFDASHAKPMITMPIGCNIELDATNQKVTILNNCVL
jgi:muramoyltetrapeptide carboxypeptidase LdcA involved in peptidoglycan recycling